MKPRNLIYIITKNAWKLLKLNYDFSRFSNLYFRNLSCFSPIFEATQIVQDPYLRKENLFYMSLIVTLAICKKHLEISGRAIFLHKLEKIYMHQYCEPVHTLINISVKNDLRNYWNSSCATLNNFWIVVDFHTCLVNRTFPVIAKSPESEPFPSR